MMLTWLRYLPNSVKERICSFLIRNRCSPPCILQSVVEIIDVNVIRNIIFMAVDELLTVWVHEFFFKFNKFNFVICLVLTLAKKCCVKLYWFQVSNLDESLLLYSDRCRFLYGTMDQWCPLHYALEMQERLGRGNFITTSIMLFIICIKMVVLAEVSFVFFRKTDRYMNILGFQSIKSLLKF